MLSTIKQTTHIGLLASIAPKRRFSTSALSLQKRRILTDILLEMKLNEWLRLVQKGKSQPMLCHRQSPTQQGRIPCCRGTWALLTKKFQLANASTDTHTYAQKTQVHTGVTNYATVAQIENQRRHSLKISLSFPDGGLQTEWPSSQRRTDWVAHFPQGDEPKWGERILSLLKLEVLTLKWL